MSTTITYTVTVRIDSGDPSDAAYEADGIMLDRLDHHTRVVSNITGEPVKHHIAWERDEQPEDESLTERIRQHLDDSEDADWWTQGAFLLDEFGALVKERAIERGADPDAIGRFDAPFTSENGEPDWGWPVTAYPAEQDEDVLSPFLLDLPAAPVEEQVEFAVDQMLNG